MKLNLSLILVFASSLCFAQPQLNAIDLQLIENIQKPNSKLAKSESTPISLITISGIQYISTLAKVNNRFKASDLPPSVILGSQIGDIITLKIPLNQAQLIHDLVNVDYVELSAKISPTITNAVKDLRADSVHAGINLHNSYTGKNVLIGVTDWGFDYSHPMFYDTALSNTRIVAVWDQFKTSGPAPASYAYGTEYVGETELLAAQSDTACSYYDYATHGSHVAGIAGGSGAGIGLRGVAFEANYLFAALGLDVASGIDAVSWMKSVADAEGKRLVINMSWGLYYLGPLDGTSIISQAFDNLVNEGVIIVTSAGNNGNDEFHIKKDFNQDSVVTRINFYPYSAHASMWGQSVSMWG
ncbi:MAG: subtilisin family serine protease, partial [Halieaceae bacterium]